jgi:hypothetical protein
MNFSFKNVHKSLFFLSLFVLIPLWNIPHTIAGRYICEAILLLTTISYKPNWNLFFRNIKILLVFFIYLFIQLIFFSKNFSIAFSNFRGEWMHFILFSIIGAGVGLTLGKMNVSKILLYLGIAFSIPLYIHIILFSYKGLSDGAVPWGYWGISEIHGDFGYPALEAGILIFTFYLYQATEKSERYIAIGLLGLCILSPLLATSRGGTGFTIAGLLFVFFCRLLIGNQSKTTFSKKLVYLLTALFLMLGVYKVGMISSPDRWGGIISRLSIGLQGNPSETYCNGIEALKAALTEKGIIITPEVQKGLDSVNDGDGARMMAARSGSMLVLQNPMGINQSKQAYQQAIATFCGYSPKIFIAHAHNAWIDTALAIGIPGAILLLLVLLQYGRLGYRALKENSTATAYGAALLASSIMWILRGLLDSTMRDQMLEMQAFIFALLLGLILSTRNKE